jgi:ATP-dependent Clp protease ATP-binding subunit ClpC
MDSLRRVFRPEFINRVDNVIVFRALSKQDIEQIVMLEINKVALRLEEHSIQLNSSQEALDLLAEAGYDPEMGARPLRRVIQQKIEDPLSDALLSGDFVDGDSVMVEVEEGKVVLRRSESEIKQPPEALPAN